MEGIFFLKHGLSMQLRLALNSQRHNYRCVPPHLAPQRGDFYTVQRGSPWYWFKALLLCAWSPITEKKVSN